MGNEILAAASTTSKSGSGYFFLLIIVALFGLLYFVTIRPQRNRQRMAMQTQRDIVPGTRIRTTAGMYATVTAIQDQDVILEVAPGVEVRYLRRAILDVVSPPVEPLLDDQAPGQSGTFGEAEDDAATGG